MPYNLRKRKVIEPNFVEPPKKVSKKEPAAAKLPKKEPAATRIPKEPATTKPPKEPTTTKPPKEPATIKTPKEPATTKLQKEGQTAAKPLKEPATIKPPKEPATSKIQKEDQAAAKPPKEPTTIKPLKEPVATKPPKELVTPKDQKEEQAATKLQRDEYANAKSLKEPTATKPKIVSECNQLVFGADSCGELGFKKIGFRKKNPTPVPIEDKIKQVACGPMHTVSLTESGKVYTYGCNDEGALGRETDGDEDLESTPTIVQLDSKVIKVTAGDSHTAALTDDNRVFVWGNFRDEHGSVGLTPECDGEASTRPIQILPELKLKDVASGSNHILLLDAEGVAYSFGVGAQGQLGRLGPDQVGDETDKATKISADNRKVFLNPQEINFVNVDPKTKFVCDAVYAGNFSSFATNTDKKKNRLAGWGLNNYYQLGFKGQGQNTQHFPKRSTFTCSTSMIDVACGQHHTLFLTKTGRVYVAGRNQYGMLGLGNETKDVCPARHLETLPKKVTSISAGINTSFAVSDDGKLFSWGMSGPSLGVDGDDDLNAPTEVKKFEDKTVKSVSTGGSFTAVLVE